MSWTFIVKNLFFLTLLAAPHMWEKAHTNVVMVIDQHQWTFEAYPTWVALIIFLWASWITLLLCKRLLTWLFNIESLELRMARALVHLDGQDTKKLSKLCSKKNITDTAWIAMVHLKSLKSANDALFQEAMAHASTFAFLKTWCLRQQAKRSLKKNERDVAHELLKNLFDMHDHSPWTIENLFYSSLSQGEVDLAQKVLQTARRENISSKSFHWEGELLFHKAQQWKGDPKKKIWLLEKALVLLPQKAHIFYELACLHLEQQDDKRAVHILKTGWQNQPDPALVELFCRIYHKNTKTERFEAAKQLTEDAKLHPLSLLLMAFVALDANLKPFVLQAIDHLKKQGYTSWCFYLQSKIEIRKEQRYDPALSASYQCIYALDPTLRVFVQHFTHDARAA